MKDVKPGCLAEIWPLSADLECEPLVAEMLLDEGREAQFVGGIILLNKVLDDGTTLPKSEVGV